MSTNILLLTLLLSFVSIGAAQDFRGYSIGSNFKDVERLGESWQKLEGLSMTIQPKDSLLSQVVINLDKNGNIYNIMLTSIKGKEGCKSLLSYLTKNYEGYKKDIVGSCLDGALNKVLWVKENIKLDYKESCNGEKQATVNIMKLQ